ARAANLVASARPHRNRTRFRGRAVIIDAGGPKGCPRGAHRSSQLVRVGSTAGASTLLRRAGPPVDDPDNLGTTDRDDPMNLPYVVIPRVFGHPLPVAPRQPSRITPPAGWSYSTRNLGQTLRVLSPGRRS